MIGCEGNGLVGCMKDSGWCLGNVVEAVEDMIRKLSDHMRGLLGLCLGW